MFAFLALLFILLAFYFFTSDNIQTEGFDPIPQHKINIPSTVPITPAPPARNIDDSHVKPSDLPGKLPVAPYQQIAAMSPLPYQDTALIKANRQQLINQLELLKGFLSFEAQEISERSDPNIQLPLNTARSDFHVLQSEVDVLNRNPGIQPTITLLHLNEISSNLAYLQRQVRLIGSAGTLQGPVYEFTERSTEGFVDGMEDGFVDEMEEGFIAVNIPVNFIVEYNTDKDGKIKIYANTDATAFIGKILDSTYREIVRKVSINKRSMPRKKDNHTENKNYYMIYSGDIGNNSMFSVNTMYRITSWDKTMEYGTFIYNPSGGTQSIKLAQKNISPSTIPKPVPKPIPKPNATNDIASVADLERFIGGISADIIRLTASGTTNPINAARVKALTQIKNEVNTILEQVKTKKLKPEEIPIFKKDINNAFPILGNPSKPLPQIIQKYNLPPWLASLLPPDVSNDPEMSKQVNSLIHKYADTIVNGLSASFSVKYTSPRDSKEINSHKSTVSKTGFPSASDLKACSGNTLTGNTPKMDVSFGGTTITDNLASKPQEAGRGPSHFDWESRAKEIEGQVKKRGLHPKDFGINPPNTKVSKDFSWKGYARMICTRLQTTTDPSLPETCGCPPMDWKGWRISK